MRLFAPLSAASAVALLTACPCAKDASSAPAPVGSLASPGLHAEYVPGNDGTFHALTRVSARPSSSAGCIELKTTATSAVGGVALPATQPSSAETDCSCRSTSFAGTGTIPAATDGTFNVKDDTGELSMTVPSLFVAPTVAIEDQAGGALAALARSSRVYLVFSPANFTDMAEIDLAFTATGATAPAFRLSTAPGGGVVKDGTRWYFDVPASAAAGAGVLEVKTIATLQTTSCTTSALRETLLCNALSLAARRVSTAVQ